MVGFEGMKIYLGEQSKEKSFFFSVPMKEKGKYLSFDWTLKGRRVLIQDLQGTQEVPKDKEPDGEWYTLVIEDGELIGKEHDVWYDYGETDIVNGEVWVQEKEWPLSEDVAIGLGKYALLITSHQNELENYQTEIKELESMFRAQAQKLGVELI